MNHTPNKVNMVIATDTCAMASNAALNRRRRSGQADGRPKPEARTEVLEVGEADRRLDALIEEEQRAKAAGPRRSMSTPPLEGPRGAPIALSLGFPGSQGREGRMSTGDIEGTLRSVRPSVTLPPGQQHGDPAGHQGGLGALQETTQRT